MAHEKEHPISTITGLGLGLALGGISALLLAPRSGWQTRQGIIDVVNEIKDSAEEIFADATSAAHKIFEGILAVTAGDEEPLRKKIQKFKADLDELSINEA